jgi:hypothetical protein
MTRALTLGTAIALAVLPLEASAQDSVTKFRLTGDPGNISGCIALESSMARVHTLTVAGGNASLKFAGGIDQKLKPSKPGLYVADFEMSGARLDVTADTTVTPNTLTVISKALNCKWTGQPE